MASTANGKNTIIPSSSRKSVCDRGGQDGGVDDLPIVYASTVSEQPVVSPISEAAAAFSDEEQQEHGQYGDEMGEIEPEIPLSIVEIDSPQPLSSLPTIVTTSYTRDDAGGININTEDSSGIHEGDTMRNAKSSTNCFFTYYHHRNGNIGCSVGDGMSCSNEGEESPWEKKCRRRRRRKTRMVVGGITGLVVGTVILCFPGAILGTVVGVWATRSISKRRENLKDERAAMAAAAAATTAVDSPVAVATRVGDA